MTSRASRSVRLLAATCLGVLALVACASEPSPKRVALDMVKTLDIPEDQQQCMIDKIEDDYTAEEIEQLGDSNEGFDFRRLEMPAADDEDEHAEALREFVDDLRSCRR